MAMTYNKVFLAGRLVNDPDVREVQTAKGPTSIAEYTLAVDTGFGAHKRTDFIRCEAWGRNAEFATKWLVKGRNIFVEGSWTTNKYTNKDGLKINQSKCKVMCHCFTGERMAIQQNEEVRNDDFFVQLAQNGANDEDFIQIPDGVEDNGLPFN